MTATITAPKRTTKSTAKPATKAGKSKSATAKARACKTLPTGMPLMIGLDKLTADPMNVRPSGGDVNELAASIAAHGIIQPLAVRIETRPDRKNPDKSPHPTGRYLVVAGGRRLRALMKLAGDRRLPKDAGVPCVVRNSSERDAAEVSLAENVERAPMNAADEHAAFAKLADEGMSSTDIATRFGINKRRVEQRLALGRIAPDLLDQLRKGAMTAGVAQALTLTTSHEKQHDVWRQCKGGWNSEVQARRLLTEQAMSFDDPLLRFVGRATYEKAGGPVRVDLFSKDGDEAGFAEDAALVRKLAAAELDAQAEKVRKEERWAFVVHELQEDVDPYGYRREQPKRREPTEGEAKRQAEVEQELTAMEDEGWDDTTAEGRAAAERWDRLEHELEDLEAQREQWTPEQKQRCGVYFGIGEGGQVEQRRGLVDPAWDRKQRESAETKHTEQRDASDKPGAEAQVSADGDTEKESESVRMPRTLVWKLTKARTEALRASMIENPTASADLLIAHLCERFFFSVQFAGRDPLPFEIDLRVGRNDFCAGTGKSDPARGSHETPQPSEAQTVFYDALQQWRSRLPQTPDALPAFVAGLSPEDKTSLLALLSAAALDTVNDSVGDFHGSKGDQTIRRVASHVDCDVTKWWKPTTASFFGGLTKAAIAAALDEAYTQTHGKTLSSGAGVDGLKKNAAAGRAEALVSKLDWLPLPLRSAHQPRQLKQDDDSKADSIKLPTANGTTPTKLAA